MMSFEISLIKKFIQITNLILTPKKSNMKKNKKILLYLLLQ